MHTCGFTHNWVVTCHNAAAELVCCVLPSKAVTNILFLVVQPPGSISQTEAGDVETDGVDSDDDNDVLKSEQVMPAHA